MRAEQIHDPGPDTNTNPCPGCNDTGDPTWCQTDGARVITAITSLPDHCRHLTAGTHNTGTDVDLGVHTLNVHPPSPSPAWDTADEVIRWAVHTEDNLRAHQGHADRRTEPYRTLATAVAYLSAQSASLLASPDAEHVGLHALALAKRLEQITGTDQPTTRLSQPCPHCHNRGLEHIDGDETVRCRTCLGSWPWSHYVALQSALPGAP